MCARCTKRCEPTWRRRAAVPTVVDPAATGNPRPGSNAGTGGSARVGAVPGGLASARLERLRTIRGPHAGGGTSAAIRSEVAAYQLRAQNSHWLSRPDFLKALRVQIA